MDEYLEGIRNRQPQFRQRNDQDDEMFARLMTACRGVPHLATCIYETLKSAGLRVVPDDIRK